MDTNLIQMCESDQDSLQFLAQSYLYPDKAFKRMREYNITGHKLSILWISCCNKDTLKCLRIMMENDVDDIKRHINYNRGRPIPYD